MMVVNEINEQCEAFIKILDWNNLNKVSTNEPLLKIWNHACSEWLTNPKEDLESGNGNWTMVWYEIELQQKAMAEY